MRFIIIIYVLLGLCTSNVYSQELNAKVTINSDKIQGVEKDIFTNLENSLMEMLNQHKWTNTVFSQNEKIECNFTLTLSGMPETDSYTADLQITSRRPVYNSTYMTATFMFKDADASFTYTQGELIEFNETNITSNLVAIFAYYAYIVLGLDFDSFALNGGKPYYDQAMNIVNSSQSLSTKGWAAFENDRNRYALALALTEESSNRFHDMWYTYHRLGLDEMATNTVRGRDKVIESLKDLTTIYNARPASPLLLFYGDTKLNELADIYSEVSADEKKEAYELLRRIYPTRTTQLDAIRKQQ